MNAPTKSQYKPKVPEHLIIVARVGAAQGVKGWVKLHSETYPKASAFEYAGWHLYQSGKWEEIELVEWREHGKGFIGRFKDSMDRTQAEQYRNAWVAVPKTSLPETEEDEFYYHQLEGLSVVTLSGEVLGKVSYLFNTGSNDVMVVVPTSESLDDRERMLPYLAPYVASTDLSAGVIQVDWDPEF